tara:strand:- start:25725 stop:26441 length:717 start_codon:yes stop_codon:yes gene_type:complete
MFDIFTFKNSYPNPQLSPPQLHPDLVPKLLLGYAHSEAPASYLKISVRNTILIALTKKKKMGRSRYRIHEEHNPYFITSSVINQIALFKNPKLVKIILDGLIFLQEERNIELNAYVVMENHIHIIAKGTNLGEHIRNFKSFSAHQIIKALKKKKDHLSLNKLKQAKKSHKIESEHQVWEESYHPKQLFTYKMVAQKMDYIHFNPVKRGYVDEPSHWRYSSARNYDGRAGLIPITMFSG